jgi:carbon-monoxide dehydrogenase small subunit
MSARNIVNSGKEYSDEELRRLLSGHLCRCTGYENIFRAVRKTARGRKTTDRRD